MTADPVTEEDLVALGADLTEPASPSPVRPKGPAGPMLVGPRPSRTHPDDALVLRYEPAAGFMRAFDVYADAATDAPSVFRPFTALSILAALVSREVIANFGPFPLSLLLYTLLLAPSSFMRKSTMISMAKRIVGTVEPARVLADDFTPERFLALLQTRPDRLFGIAEFSGFLARASRDYNQGIRELFMELYDAPPTFRRETRGETITIERPTVTILAASATSWLAESMRTGDTRSGFLNRFLLVLAEDKAKCYPLPVRPPRALWDAVIDQARGLAALKGEVSFSQIEGRYSAWYRDLERQARRCDNETLSGFLTRLSVSVLKIAALLELAQSQRFAVTLAALEDAVVLADYLAAVIRHLLRVEFAVTDDSRDLMRVLQVITKAPGCAKKRILQQTGYKARRADEALSTLLQRGDVEVRNRGYWPLDRVDG